MLSTFWNPQRGSWSYTEKKRGRKEIEVTRRRKGGIKRRERERKRERDLASNQLLKCSSQLGTLREIHKVK